MSEAPPNGASKLQDLVGGGLAIAFGVGTLVTSLGYPMGSVLRMGPGLFPSILAVLIIGLGVLMVIGGLRSRVLVSKIKINYRALLSIAAGMVLFALMLPRFGLVPATLTLVLVSSLSEPKWRPLRALTLAVCMTVFVYVVFILILKTPIAVVRF